MRVPDGFVEVGDDGTVARFRRRFATTADDLWSALTDPERLARWYTAVSGDLRPGGTVRMHWPDGQVQDIEVVTCRPPELLVTRWTLDDGPLGEVTVVLRPDGDGCVLDLEHRGLPPMQAAGYAAGWHAHLAGLSAHLTGSAADWDTEFAAALPRYRAAADAAGAAGGRGGTPVTSPGGTPGGGRPGRSAADQ
ncbi:SRPBCC family protein [Nakamurella endophytica]|uniref:Activator of Hsp90 ATPase homologue 1/2-like C-terminal domain-containing protein n=1 Tax=Nakamurella endophytica TaxID=1748367 RepID=A0A917W9C9_9ACTN|nr:SRPBCC family protein [Nakamurella endophytica]GGL85615.1 hypothetical protein GCM10011594_01570 [Nakamurella endophytica]